MARQDGDAGRDLPRPIGPKEVLPPLQPNAAADDSRCQEFGNAEGDGYVAEAPCESFVAEARATASCPAYGR